MKDKREQAGPDTPIVMQSKGLEELFPHHYTGAKPGGHRIVGNGES